MATISIPGGEIQTARVRPMHHYNVYLGHFSMPHLNGKPTLIKHDIDGYTCLELQILGRRLAMTAYKGWDAIEHRTIKDKHPEAESSTLLYAAMREKKRFQPPTILISIQLHKTNDSDWTKEELQPIATVEPLTKNGIMHLTGLTITLKNGKKYKVDYQDIDGTSSVW